jgi:hypothetical protein
MPILAYGDVTFSDDHETMNRVIWELDLKESRPEI